MKQLREQREGTYDVVGSEIEDIEPVDFRHLSAFQRVYLERSYANAGHHLLTTRKSIRRMMDNLERAFQCSLFIAVEDGELQPSAFADRLFNDLRFLNATRNRLSDHVSDVHEIGRVLHIGSSPAVFRTRAFRNLFRELQLLKGIRTSFTPVDPTDVGKALVSGLCDLYIGCWKGNPKRSVTQLVGDVTFCLYSTASARSGSEVFRNGPPKAFVVALEGGKVDPPVALRREYQWAPLTETQWLNWMDRPDACPPGTVVYAPDTSVDPSRWQVFDAPGIEPAAVHLHATFLRHHPYEFLPALAGQIGMRTRN